MKELWWNYFLVNKQYWGNGITLKRLKEHDEDIYNHAMGNMSGMIMSIIKPPQH